MDLTLFIKLAKLFKENGFNLYLVGGSSRDYLLKRYFTDFDLATDATPTNMSQFLKDANYHYAKFGNVHLKNMDITTLRIENDYLDSRHPNDIKFTKSIKDDFKRRDFTINAIYLDSNLQVFDFGNGINDLKNKVIRFIGDPNVRVIEDPLRILRAMRLANKLGFKIEQESLNAMNNHRLLLKKINKDKIHQEINKALKK